MNVIEAIETRRSIRRFKPDPIERTVIEKLLEITTLAPSAKNEQPWRFVVVEDMVKEELLERVDGVLQNAIANNWPTGSLRGSLQAMRQAPVLILVFNSVSRSGLSERFEYAKFLVDTQSLGAAIQTMLLAAQSMGLGTLWICDVLYATQEICSYVDTNDELVAAVSIGLPAESPLPRPRKARSEVTTFLD